MSDENILNARNANPSIMNGEAKCPVSHGSSDQHTNRAQTNKEWWPDQVNLSILHQHDKKPIQCQKILTIKVNLKN